jgi:hypothetical protein
VKSWLDHTPLLHKTYGLLEYREHTRIEVEMPYALLEAQWVVDRTKTCGEKSRV